MNFTKDPLHNNHYLTLIYNKSFENLLIWQTGRDIEEKVISGTVRCDICSAASFTIVELHYKELNFTILSYMKQERLF